MAWRTPATATERGAAVALVLDASVILAWLLPDEDSEKAQAIVERLAGEAGHAPALLAAEVGNALAAGVRVV